jgi:acyl-CoA synthetase (AMP-forming)/AMP-acid ligase II
VREQAARNPDAISILAPGRRPLTYGHLNRQVDHVVETLNSLGISRNDRVAIVLPESPEMAVAVLAIAAGATCAPLNPAYRAASSIFI